MSDNDELEHFGVKGMRWGVRNAQSSVPRSTNREARRDATEYAKAKMYYGEGAGTRRKLINATVNAKASKDPFYKQAFDEHLNSQDMAKRASQARGQRRRTDAANTTKKTGRGIINILNGNSMAASAAAVGIVGLYQAGKHSGVNKIILDNGKTAYRDVSRYVRALKIQQQFKNFNY